MKHFPKPYIILIQDRSYGGWSIYAEYETLETAELHALDILKTEYYGSDIKIVKDLGLEVKVLNDTTDKIVCR